MFKVNNKDTVVVSVFSRNTGKSGPEKTPYLDTFHAVQVNPKNMHNKF